jgi:hypothetical protein
MKKFFKDIKIGGNNEYIVKQLSYNIISIINKKGQEQYINSDINDELNTYFKYNDSICKVIGIVNKSSNNIVRIKCECYTYIIGLYNNNNLNSTTIYLDLTDDIITNYIFSKIFSKQDLLNESKNINKVLINTLKKKIILLIILNIV